MTRFVVAPFTGAQLISATVTVHQPGETFQPHSHLISHDANLVLKGKGEVFLGGRWSDVKAGDIVYAPPLVQHATRNPITNDGPFVVVSFACPPPFELYELAGILKGGRFVGL
jgi:quercetin dioxygenase-like cupin family protein